MDSFADSLADSLAVSLVDSRAGFYRRIRSPFLSLFLLQILSPIHSLDLLAVSFIDTLIDSLAEFSHRIRLLNSLTGFAHSFSCCFSCCFSRRFSRRFACRICSQHLLAHSVPVSLSGFCCRIRSLDSRVRISYWILSPNAVFAHNSFLSCHKFQMYSLHAVT